MVLFIHLRLQRISLAASLDAGPSIKPRDIHGAHVHSPIGKIRAKIQLSILTYFSRPPAIESQLVLIGNKLLKVWYYYLL